MSSALGGRVEYYIADVIVRSSRPTDKQINKHFQTGGLTVLFPLIALHWPRKLNLQESASFDTGQ